MLDFIECFRRLYVPYWAKFATGETPAGLRLRDIAEGVPAAVTWTKVDGSLASPQRVPSRAAVAQAFVAGFAHGVPTILRWWEELLPVAFAVRGTPQPREGLPEWRFVADERMATTTFLSVRNIAWLFEGDWARLCLCDKAGDGKPYGVASSKISTNSTLTTGSRHGAPAMSCPATISLAR